MKKLLLLCLLLLALANPYTLAWIADRYVVADGLEPVDAIVSLRGSPEEERFRLEEAARLVRRRYAPVLLASVDSKAFYGHSVRQLLEAYLQQEGFPSEQLRFCENSADSTVEEVRALLSCLQKMGAKQAIVVTSEYHTRRTRFLFHRASSGSGITALIHPAYNPQYWDRHWWRRRRWAKTFAIETLSLIGNALEQWSSSWRQAPPSPEELPPPGKR